jgi:hypothetical protein
MKRKALLIGSPGTPYLNGVEQDLKNMVAFLTSANGGSWNANTEIHTVPQLDPKYSDIKPHLDSLKNYDFAFVYFTGHGYSDSNDNAKINLNATETPFVHELAQLCEKQITIIDACRGYSQYFNADGLGGGVPLFTFDNNNKIEARNIFDAYLSNCANGQVLLQAASVGQNATDTNNGGFFSTNVLRSSQDLVKSNNKAVVNVYEVFDEAFNRTKPKHEPQIAKSTDAALKLPFVINPNIRLRAKATNSSEVTLQDIGKIVATTVLVVGATALLIKLLSGGNKK